MNLNQVFKKLSKKIFSQEIDIPNEFKQFRNLLEKCRNFEGITGDNKLLLTLFDIIFLENGVPKKKNSDADLVWYFKLCLEDKLEDANFESFVKNEEKLLFDCLRNEKIFSKNDFSLLAFIMKIKKDFNLFFRSFQDIYMEKCDKYIPSKDMEIIFSEKSFETNLYDFSLLFNVLVINPKNYFSIIVEQNWFKTEAKTAIEINDFKNKNKKTNLDIVLNFINKNSSKPKTTISTNNQINNIENFKENRAKKEKEDEKYNYLIQKIERLEEEIKGIKIRETKANNTHRETVNHLNKEIDFLNKKHRERINDLNKEIDSLTKKQIEMKQKYLSLKKNHQDKIESNKNKIDQLKMANIIINEKLKKIEKEGNTIKARGISKSIINFITYAFGETNIKNKNFTEKVNFIQSSIEKKIKTKDHILLKELKLMVSEIDNLKDDGDIFAHTEMTLESFFNLVKGCENVKKIFADLNLTSMLEKFNQMYQLQFSKKNYEDVYKTIVKIMDIKKSLFNAKFGF